MEGLFEQIQEITKAARDSVFARTFPEKKHRALSSRYPSGEKAYFDNEIYTLLKDADKAGCIATLWINSGMPRVSINQIATAIVDSRTAGIMRNMFERNLKYYKDPYPENEVEIKLLEWAKDEAESFFEIYCNYFKLVGLLDGVLAGDGKQRKPPHLSIQLTDVEAKALYDGLISGGFMPKETIYSHFCRVFGGADIPDTELPFKPIKWIKTNGTTRGKTPNKKSLFDLLCLLGCPDDVVGNISLLNNYFIFSNNKPIKANNKTAITDIAGNLIRPIVSEYHTDLEAIVKQGKKNKLVTY
jgi:hypothetical protein